MGNILTMSMSMTMAMTMAMVMTTAMRMMITTTMMTMTMMGLAQYGRRAGGGLGHVPNGWTWWAGLVGNSR